MTEARIERSDLQAECLCLVCLSPSPRIQCVRIRLFDFVMSITGDSLFSVNSSTVKRVKGLVGVWSGDLRLTFDCSNSP